MASPRTSTRFIAAAAVALLAVALVCQHLLDGSMNERSLAPAGTRIQVPPGASLRSVLGELARVQAARRPAPMSSRKAPPRRPSSTSSMPARWCSRS
jgi:hypothetical protein